MQPSFGAQPSWSDPHPDRRGVPVVQAWWYGGLSEHLAPHYSRVDCTQPLLCCILMHVPCIFTDTPHFWWRWCYLSATLLAPQSLCCCFLLGKGPSCRDLNPSTAEELHHLHCGSSPVIFFSFHPASNFMPSSAHWILRSGPWCRGVPHIKPLESRQYPQWGGCTAS